MLYDPRKKDVKNQALRNHDALTVEDGGRPALAWKELKILALQNMTWALYNADTLTALAIGQFSALTLSRRALIKHRISFYLLGVACKLGFRPHFGTTVLKARVSTLYHF